MINIPIYKHQFTKIDKNGFKTYETLEKTLKKEFKNIRGRLEEGPEELGLLYVIPAKLCTHEIKINSVSFGSGERSYTYAYLNTESFFGDIMNKRVLKILENLEMEEDIERRSETTKHYREILNIRKQEFQIIEADKQVERLVEELIRNTVIYKKTEALDLTHSRMSSNKNHIHNHSLGKYIEITANIEARKKDSYFYATFIPERNAMKISINL